MSEPYSEITPELVGKWESPNKPDYWAHVVLKTTQREKMIDFYKNLFGAKVVFANDRLTFITWDQEHHRMAFIRMPAGFRIFLPVARVWRKFFGVDHLAFNFGTLERLLQLHERALSVGIEPVWCINHGPTTSIYYEDPDGNRLEFQFENFDDVQDLQNFAASGEFTENPIGVEFDPSYMLELLRKGTPESELKVRGSATRPGTKVVAGNKALRWRTL